MVSNIDPDLPKAGIPRLNKQAFEDNFGAAKEEIEDLDTRVTVLEAGGAGVTSFEGRDGVVTAQAGDYDDSEVSAAASATNYTPDAATVEGHLSGIDTALASAGGSIAVEDEGSEVVAAASTFNFVGAGVTASDAGGNEATINIPGAAGTGGSSVFENYVVVSTGTGAAFLSAFNTAVSTQVDGVILTVNVDASDLGTTDLDVPVGRQVHIFGNGFEFNPGGTAKNDSQRRFRLHGSTRWDRVNFVDGALCFSWEGNTSRIEQTEFINCRCDNVGALLHYEIENPPSASFEIGTLRVYDCIADNVTHFIRCRMGEGNAGDQVQVDRIDMRDVTISNCTNSGINLNYDGPPAGAVWPSRSLGQLTRCIFRDCPAPTEQPSFGFNLNCVETATLTDCWGIDVTGTAAVERSIFYTKNFRYALYGGGLVNCGMSDFDGVIALKGQDAGAGDTTELESCILQGLVCQITTNGIADNLIFVQRSNVQILNCRFVCPGIDFGIIGWQSADEFNNVLIENVYAEFDANTDGSFADPQSDGANIVFRDCHLISDASGTHSAIRFRCGSSAGQDITNPQVVGCTFVKRGAGTITGIDIEPRAGSGNIVNSNITGNYFIGLNTDVAFSGTTANAIGRHNVTNNNTESGALAISGTPTGGSLDSRNNST